MQRLMIPAVTCAVCLFLTGCGQQASSPPTAADQAPSMASTEPTGVTESDADSSSPTAPDDEASEGDSPERLKVKGTRSPNGRRPVPTGDVDELLEYIQDLMKDRPKIGAVEAEWVGPALKTAAERIIRQEKDQWSDAYQTALRVLLEDRIRAIRPGTPERRREAVDFVKMFLTAKLERRLERKDVDLAIALAKAVEEAGDRELAAEAYGAFAELTRKSDEEALLGSAKMMEKAAQRLQPPE